MNGAVLAELDWQLACGVRCGRVTKAGVRACRSGTLAEYYVICPDSSGLRSGPACLRCLTEVLKRVPGLSVRVFRL